MCLMRCLLLPESLSASNYGELFLAVASLSISRLNSFLLTFPFLSISLFLSLFLSLLRFVSSLESESSSPSTFILFRLCFPGHRLAAPLPLLLQAYRLGA